MTKEQFLSGIKTNMARVKEYKLGMDGRGGECDCIGLVIGAIRLMGGAWNGTHGSNYAARNEMQSLEKIASVSDLQVGDMVYKAYEKGESGYNLPSTYKSHPDQRDYYHVGVVEKVAPLSIVQCTSVPGGIKRDTALGNWQYHGLYRGLDGAETDTSYAEYRVVGGQLKMRSGPGTGYAVVAYLPDGTLVQAAPLPENGEWLQVRHNGQAGYCMARYLQKTEEAKDENQWDQLAQLLEQAMNIVNQMRAG